MFKALIFRYQKPQLPQTQFYSLLKILKLNVLHHNVYSHRMRCKSMAVAMAVHHLIDRIVLLVDYHCCATVCNSMETAKEIEIN